LKLVREYLVKQDETERQDILYIEQIARRVEWLLLTLSRYIDTPVISIYLDCKQYIEITGLDCNQGHS